LILHDWTHQLYFSLYVNINDIATHSADRRVINGKERAISTNMY